MKLRSGVVLTLSMPRTGGNLKECTMKKLIFVVLLVLVVGCYDGTQEKTITDCSEWCLDRNEQYCNNLDGHQICYEFNLWDEQCIPDDYDGEIKWYFRVNDATYSNIVDMIESECQ